MGISQPTKKPISLTSRIFAFICMMNLALLVCLTIDVLWYRIFIWWFLGIGPR